MASQRFVDLLNEQVGHEFAAHQQYVAIAVHYDQLTMPEMAALFFRQALEERDHAMMMVRYLLDVDAPARIPGVQEPTTAFVDLVAPVELALAQEKRVSEQVNALTAVARDEHDFAADQFMQWFIKEQVEEVSSMRDLLDVVRRNVGHVENIEEFLRATRDDNADRAEPGAPRIAGA